LDDRAVAYIARHVKGLRYTQYTKATELNRPRFKMRRMTGLRQILLAT